MSTTFFKASLVRWMVRVLFSQIGLGTVFFVNRFLCRLLQLLLALAA